MRRISSGISKRGASAGKSGFSLIELLVSVSILTIITAVVLAQHNQFSGNLALSNLVYDIALSVRQAQVYGLSVREFGAGSGEFDIGYGVHFDAGNSTSYALFADRNRNGRYDGESELVEVFTLGRGFVLSGLCVSPTAGAELCAPADFASLDVVFIRPDPDALIRVNTGSDLYQSLRVVARSPQGKTREVVVVATGQISVPHAY